MARTGPLWEPVLLLFAQEFDEADVLYYLAHFIVRQIVRGVHGAASAKRKDLTP